MHSKRAKLSLSSGIIANDTVTPPWLRYSQDADVIHRSEHGVVLRTDMKQAKLDQIEHIRGRGLLSKDDYQPLGLLDDVKVIYHDYRKRFGKTSLTV